MLSIQKYGPDLKSEDYPYTFDYYLQLISSNIIDNNAVVPPPFTCIKDIWGFYNGDNSKSIDGSSIDFNTKLSDYNFNQLKGLCYLGSIGVKINPKEDYAKMGLLKQIVYPTGGSIIYDYAQNVGFFRGSGVEQNVGGVHVVQTKTSDGGGANGCNNPIITNYDYSNEVGSSSSLTSLDLPNNRIGVSNHYKAEKKVFHFWGFKCEFKYRYPGILSQDEAVNLTAGQQLLVALSEVLDVISTVLEVLDIVVLCCGPTPMAIFAVALDIWANIVSIFLTCFGGDLIQDGHSEVVFNFDLNSVNPLPVQFKTVHVIPQWGQIGKTVYHFTNEEDDPIWNVTNPINSMKQRYPSWSYGLPKRTSVYRKINNQYKKNQRN